LVTGINSLVITPWASCDILAHSKMLDKFFYNFFKSVDNLFIKLEETMKKIIDEAKHYWVEHKKVVIAVGVILIIAIIV